MTFWDKTNEKIKKYESLFKLIIAILGIIATIFAAYFGAYIAISNSYRQIENQKTNDLKNLAIGYSNDIENVNESVSAFLLNYNDKNNPDYHSYGIAIAPFYPEWGLYFSTNQEISKFEPQMAKDLYEFYFLVLKAEDLRKQLNNFDNLYPINPNGPSEPQIQNRKETKTKMAILLIDILNELHDYRIPNLESSLKKYINTNNK